MKKQGNVEQVVRAGSPHSQEWILQQRDMHARLEAIESSIRATESEIGEMEGEIDRITRRMVDQGRPEFREGLDRETGRLRTRRDRLEAYKGQRLRIEQEIQASIPTPQQIQTRKENQGKVLTLANERRGAARTAAGLIGQLSAAVHRCIELSAKMREPIEALNLGGSMDAARFEAVLNSLPEDLLSRSEDWYEVFFGVAGEAKRYVVTEKTLTLGETWASHGVHSFGDIVQLAEREARELLREDRPVPGSRFPGACLPARVMPLAEFEALAAEAKEEKKSITLLLALAREQHAEARRRESEEPQAAMPSEGWSLTITDLANAGKI